jgi:hypothetical protein
MLRDIALDAFEEAGEAEALESVDAIQDGKLLAQVAKSAGRDIVALRAVSRVSDVKALGSIARHAVVEAARRAAFEHVREREDLPEIVAVAINGDYKDTAVAAVDVITDETQLEQIAERGRNKAASKRARALLRESADQRARAAADTAAAARAIDSATYGQPVKLRNEITKEVFEAVVTGQQEAMVGSPGIGGYSPTRNGPGDSPRSQPGESARPRAADGAAQTCPDSIALSKPQTSQTSTRRAPSPFPRHRP